MNQLSELGKRILDFAPAGGVVDTVSLCLSGCKTEGAVTLVDSWVLS